MRAQTSDQTTTYFYETNSNAAPFCSDSDYGFVEATDPVEALKKIVKKYRHPAGLFPALISEASEKRKSLARYLSGRAATAQYAPCGMTHWEKDGLVVDGKKYAIKQSMIEVREGRKWKALEEIVA